MRTSVALFAILVIIIVFTITCKKDPAKLPLPPITQEGRNTFGFKVNGEDWVPYHKCEIFGNPCGQLSTGFIPYTNNILPTDLDWQVQKVIGKDFTEGLTISSWQRPISKAGDIFDSLSISFLAKDGFTYESYGGINNPRKKSTDHFTITKLDTVNNIISGTFSFLLYRYQDSIEITDGRFDLKLQSTCECTH